MLGSLSATFNLFYWSEALKSRYEVVYVVNGTRFRALRACGAREVDFYHELNFFTKTFKLFYWSEALQSHFEVAYVVSVTRFCALRARARAKRDFFSWIDFFCRDGSNEVSHAPGRVPEVCFIPDRDRHTGRIDITKIYI